MATGFFYKKWDDVGAPQLDSGAGNLIPILDWALDVGTATYWEKVYTGTNIAAYRSKTGLRPYLQVDDTPNETCLLRMFETMTDVNTGTGQCPNGITQADYLRMTKGDAGDGAVGHQYWIVGDSEYFIMIAEADATYRYSGYATNMRNFGFGEIASYLAVDGYPCVLFGIQSGSDASDYNDSTGCLLGDYARGNPGGTSSDSAGAGDPGFNVSLVWLKTADGAVDSSGGFHYCPTTTNQLYRMTAENPFIYYPHYIQCSNGSVSSSSTAFWGAGNTQATMRGRLPYVYRHMAVYAASNNGPITNDTITVGSSQFVNCMTTYGGTTGGNTTDRHYMLRITNDEPDRP